jgi:hypothetical protein
MIIGIVPIVIGVIALSYGGVSFNSSEEVAEVGRLKIETDKMRSVPLLGARALWSGGRAGCVGARRRLSVRDVVLKSNVSCLTQRSTGTTFMGRRAPGY